MLQPVTKDSQVLFLVLHVIGSGLLVGVVVFSIILNIQNVVTQERLKIFQLIRDTGTYAAILQLVTGLVLYFQEPGEYNESTYFWIKIGLFVLDGIIAVIIIDRKTKNALATKTGETAPTSRMTIWLLANLVIIISIIALGVYIVER